MVAKIDAKDISLSIARIQWLLSLSSLIPETKNKKKQIFVPKLNWKNIKGTEHV
jgi:hypothetical protein